MNGEDGSHGRFKVMANNVIASGRLMTPGGRNRVVLTDDMMSNLSGNSVSNHIGDHVPVDMSDTGAICDKEEIGENSVITDQVGVAKVETATADVIINEYPVDCFPDKWYNLCPSCMEETPLMLRWKDLRYKAYSLVENKYFETICIALILLSSMTLVRFSEQRTRKQNTKN
jgi:hypothetical protein